MGIRLPIPITDMLIRYQLVLRHVLLFIGVVVTLPVLVAGVQVEDSPTRRMLLLYIAPLWFQAFLWLRARVAEPVLWKPSALATDVLVLGLSALRMIPLPLFSYSGHMLFLVYTAFTTREQLYRYAAGVLLIETTVFKLWLWNDWASWSIGIALGLIGAGVHRASLQHSKQHNATARQ